MQTLAIHTLIPSSSSPHQPKLHVHIDSERVNKFISGDISPYFAHKKELGFHYLIIASVHCNKRERRKGGGLVSSRSSQPAQRDEFQLADF